MYLLFVLFNLFLSWFCRRRIGEVKPFDYTKAVDVIMNQLQSSIQMIFVILPNQVHDVYSAVKKRACLEFGG